MSYCTDENKNNFNLSCDACKLRKGCHRICCCINQNKRHTQIISDVIHISADRHLHRSLSTALQCSVIKSCQNQHERHCRHVVENNDGNDDYIERQWTRAPIIRDVYTTFPRNDFLFSYIVIPKEKLIYIYFAGTEDMCDLRYDLDFRRFYLCHDDIDGDVSVHRGFWNRYCDLQYELERTLDDLWDNYISCSCKKDKKWTLVMSGHSLGGTTAILACAFSDNIQQWVYNKENKDDSKSLLNVCLVVTGTPLCVCKKLKTYLETQPCLTIYNFANNYDVICSHLLYPGWCCWVGERYNIPVPLSCMMASHSPSTYCRTISYQLENYSCCCN